MYKLIQKVAKKQRDLRESPQRLIPVDDDNLAFALKQKGVGTFSNSKLKAIISTLNQKYSLGELKKHFSFNYDSKVAVYLFNNLYIICNSDKVIGLIQFETDRVALSHTLKEIEVTTSILLWKDDNFKQDLSIQKIIFDKLFPIHKSILSDNAFALQGEKNWHSFVKKSFEKGYNVFRVVNQQVQHCYKNYAEYEKDIPNLFHTNSNYSKLKVLVTMTDIDFVDPVNLPYEAIREDLWL